MCAQVLRNAEDCADAVISGAEYGAAGLRGLSDRDTITAMLAIADSRFQRAPLERAKGALRQAEYRR